MSATPALSDLSDADIFAPLSDTPPRSEAPTLSSAPWQPRLNPTQRQIFESSARFLLAYGEKGSGKTLACLHALVRHCYEEENALAIIIAPQIRTGKEGVIYDLEWILDIWRNGNFDPADHTRTQRCDDGLGIEYTPPSLDAQTKDRNLYIRNRHGGWSKVLLMSIPYAEVVSKRMKALSPSFVYVDEITELDSREFFTYVAQQLGRRRSILGPQQYFASCNPEGPSHWVYKVFFDDCLDAASGARDPDYEVYHVPIAENVINLPAGYIEQLKKLYRDPIDAERLLQGRWVDRASGEAIFRLYFRPEFHVRGDSRTGAYLTPKKGVPILVGYDPGPVNYCVSFMQMIPTKEKTVWIVFDELNFVGQFMADYLVVPRILARMDYWNAKLLGQATFVHIADEAAFTHKRQDGSYDSTRIQQLSQGRIRMRACPKGKESVPARTQMVITLLLDEALYISALCPRTIEMFKLLISEKQRKDSYDSRAGLRPQRSAYLHPFDAMTYPQFYFSLNPAAFALQTAPASPNVFRAGTG